MPSYGPIFVYLGCNKKKLLCLGNMFEIKTFSFPFLSKEKISFEFKDKVDNQRMHSNTYPLIKN